ENEREPDETGDEPPLHLTPPPKPNGSGFPRDAANVNDGQSISFSSSPSFSFSSSFCGGGWSDGGSASEGMPPPPAGRLTQRSAFWMRNWASSGRWLTA